MAMKKGKESGNPTVGTKINLKLVDPANGRTILNVQMQPNDPFGHLKESILRRESAVAISILRGNQSVKDTHTPASLGLKAGDVLTMIIHMPSFVSVSPQKKTFLCFFSSKF